MSNSLNTAKNQYQDAKIETTEKEIFIQQAKENIALNLKSQAQVFGLKEQDMARMAHKLTELNQPAINIQLSEQENKQLQSLYKKMTGQETARQDGVLAQDIREIYETNIKAQVPTADKSQVRAAATAQFVTHDASRQILFKEETEQLGKDSGIPFIDTLKSTVNNEKEQRDNFKQLFEATVVKDQYDQPSIQTGLLTDNLNKHAESIQLYEQAYSVELDAKKELSTEMLRDKMRDKSIEVPELDQEQQREQEYDEPSR